ncbi:hypothetical protein KQX54_009869 [Cotesia glomerata]|uniref:Uncharacterized protein n=1 Tax=Cotesia glomerata TaxID=32391 RepID=A0AAV7J1X3_COTGL|nr:hypothetical protein KQX54_009869 [Cotesia glomerata]
MGVWTCGCVACPRRECTLQLILCTLERNLGITSGNEISNTIVFSGKCQMSDDIAMRIGLARPKVLQSVLSDGT